MIGFIIVREFINGVYELVQTIKYSDGKVVRRLLDDKGMPIAILPPKPSK